ncbi:MAG TPA: crosslink repair DNA glycosylase YcaQ family protein [Candidatus Limnocylindrales bacterium]|nr:crosslink repair DNA glycosylase YcaQ family protein [Candidatus Limnocylindrales bacterium]
MTAARPRLALSRQQILGHRRRVGALDARLPFGPASLRRAAWAGLQDSMPRAALLSVHARVAGTRADLLHDASLAQVWGPRFSNYVVAAEDVPVFTLGRLPDDEAGRRRALETADRLDAFLAGRRMGYGLAGDAMGVNANSLRYATTTGRVLMRWEGARQPIIWIVPPPAMSATDARLELARRYLHVSGPGTPVSFAKWAGIGGREATAGFEALRDELIDVRTPQGDGVLLAADEASFRAGPDRPATVRLLPSGDPYYLFWGDSRDLLVGDSRRRAELWTSRVWPGALLLDGEVAGTWRRDQARLTVTPWRAMSGAERDATQAEAASLPLPNLQVPPTVDWTTGPS